MNKFLWRLFGIDEDEIPDPSRRGFLKMLGGAAIVGAAAPKYFFAPEGGWNAGRIVAPMLNLEGITAATMDYIVPSLVDNIFKASPLLTYLRDTKPKRFSGGLTIRTPIQYDRLG